MTNETDTQGLIWHDPAEKPSHGGPVIAEFNEWDHPTNPAKEHVVWWWEGQWRTYPRVDDRAYVNRWREIPSVPGYGAPIVLRPIETAPKDGTVILGFTRSDMPESEGGWSPHRWNGKFVPMRHEGATPSGYDLGWSVALPVGHGGLPDAWFAGWLPMPEAQVA